MTPLSLDITSTTQIQAAAGQVESLDMLINNAGIALYDDLTDPAAFEHHLAVNLFGTYAMTHRAHRAPPDFATSRDRRCGNGRGATLLE